jgi:hypothetical protein
MQLRNGQKKVIAKQKLKMRVVVKYQTIEPPLSELSDRNGYNFNSMNGRSGKLIIHR